MTAVGPVLVATQVDDPTADLVIRELNARGVPVLRVDPGKDFPGAVTFSARLSGGTWSGDLATTTRRTALKAVRSVYWRRPSPYSSSAGLDEQDAEFARTQARFGFGGVLQALDALHVNHPRRVHTAEYKPAQLATAAKLGFSVPSTLITNDPGEAREFAETHGPIIYKVLRQTGYEKDGKAATVWVDEVKAADLDESVAGTAHLFQQKVTKAADVRVTVVQDRVFCVRIDSQDGLLDWRTDYSQLAYTVVRPPEGVAKALRIYLDEFGLTFGCFDFAIACDGRWIWIECNPNGQWAWMEDPTGLPMAAAFADLLERHDRLC